MTAYPTIDPRHFELLETCRARYAQLLNSADTTADDLNACEMAIQYCLAEMMASQRAQRPKRSIGNFFRSIFHKAAPAPTPSVG